MKIAAYYPSQPNLIAHATSDCGRIKYSPIWNDAIRDETRGATIYGGCYCDANGMMTSERIGDDAKTIMIALMREVDAHNDAAREHIKQAAHAAQDSRYSERSARIAAEMDRPDSDL